MKIMKMTKVIKRTWMMREYKNLMQNQNLEGNETVKKFKFTQNMVFERRDRSPGAHRGSKGVDIYLLFTSLLKLFYISFFLH